MDRIVVFIATLIFIGGAAIAEPSAPVASPPPRARVVIAEETGAVIAFQAQPEKVRAALNRGITFFTGATNVALAWRTLVTTQDVIGIKVVSSPGANSGTRPSVVSAVVEGLLSAGIAPKKIIIWDRRMSDLRAAGYVEMAAHYKVRVAGSAETGYDENVFYESPVIGNLVYGDHDFEKKGGGRKSYVSRLVAGEMTRIISISPLLNHNLAGISGHLFSLTMGSIDNMLRFEAPERLATAIPEIYALPALGDHVILNITDALLCQYQGEQLSLLHYSTPLNQLWFSKDPVALDVLGLQELERQRRAAMISPPKANSDLYQNAALLELGNNEIKNITIELAR